MTQVTADTSPQAPLPMVQLLQLLNLASHYFGRRQSEPLKMTTLPTEISTETAHDWSITLNSTSYSFENKDQKLNEIRSDVVEAVKKDNLTLLRQLIKEGVNLSMTDGMGLSALHWAVLGDHVDIILVLLNNSADPNLRTVMDNTPLHKAARAGNLPACRYLLQYEADVNAVNLRGNTPLHVAARWGRIDVATLLFHHGADLTILNNWGRTPAQEAAANNKTEVQNLFKEEEVRRNTNNSTASGDPQPEWYLTTRTNKTQAVLYIPTGAEIPTSTTSIPLTYTVSTIVSTPASTVISPSFTTEPSVPAVQQIMTTIMSNLVNTTHTNSKLSSEFNNI